jgi:protein O-mannosyl-transferase
MIDKFHNLLEAKRMNWFIPVLAILLYANTLTNDFALDDGIVITENEYTQKGFAGIWDILTTDSFTGFFKDKDKQNLVSGGRYRPLSVVLYAIEYQIFGKNAFMGHLFTILWYALLCFILYKTLMLLLVKIQNGVVIAGLSAIIFTMHPIHTEAVANIKGRDEILALLFSVLALYLAVKWADLGKRKYLAFSAISLFLGLMAKENSITFLGVIPLAIWLFRDGGLKNAFVAGLMLIIPAIVFIFIRQSILSNAFAAESMELMNNPFLKFVNDRYVPFTPSERLATIIYTWGIYLKILLFPLVLTHDYYPRHIPIMNFSDVKVIFSILIHIGLVIIALKNIHKNKVIAFAILFYFMTFSIVSNLFFPIGTNMAERFMFMPSVGFAVLLGYGITYLFSKYQQFGAGLLLILFSFYSVKTFTRNRAWKDNYTLFSTDIKHSPESAKLLNALGGSIIDKYKEDKDEGKKIKAMDEAIGYLKKSMLIHPIFEGSDLLFGNALYFKKDYEGAIAQYRKILTYDPDQKNAKNNLAFTLREYGKYAGETLQNLDMALASLSESYTLNQNDLETMRLLAVAYGMKGQHDKVIEILLQFLQKDDKNANVFYNLAKAYAFKGDSVNEKLYIEKALALDPNILKGN